MADDKTELSDYEAVLSCLKGNTNDFAILVDRYKNLVYSVLSRMTNNTDEYADIAQEIFIKVYKNLDKYRPDYHFSTWIIRITTNHVIDLRRKKHIESTPIDEVDFSLTNRRSRLRLMRFSPKAVRKVKALQLTDRKDLLSLQPPDQVTWWT